MNRVLSDYYRLPSEMLPRVEDGTFSGKPGFFRFGPETICYGQCDRGVAQDVAGSERFDALEQVHLNGAGIRLPFDASDVIENLRRERYEKNLVPGRERIVSREWIRKAYYLGRELLPVSVRRHMQRAYFSDWQSLPFPSWPVDTTVDRLHEELLRLLMEARGISRMPFVWFWPQGAPGCLIMTHDVETAAGRDFTGRLMDLDDSYGIKASFQVIPEKRYEVPQEYIDQIKDRGFEFNVHDLNHDGKLYQKREEFLRRAARINEYCRRHGARGFRAGSMYRIADWYEAFEFSYDMSVPNVAHLEPRRGGCCTVMPYFVGNIVELPLTTVQDYSLFYILNNYSIELWKTQLSRIRKQYGLMSFITHPDYLIDPANRAVFESLLAHLRQMVVSEGVWEALPREVDSWWRARSQMKIVRRGENWEIEGPQKDRARLAFAVLEAGQVSYEVPGVTIPGDQHEGHVVQRRISTSLMRGSSNGSSHFRSDGAGAIVLGGDYQGLGIVRSLGRHGIPVCVIDDERSISRYSRYAMVSKRVPSLKDPQQALRSLLDLAQNQGMKGWVLYPTRDEQVAILSQYREELSTMFRVPTPNWDTVKWFWDKRQTYALAERLEIPAPRTWYPRTIGDLDQIDGHFPVALKPAIKEHFIYATKQKAWRADNPQQLRSLFERALKHIPAQEVMIQDLIPGDGTCQYASCSFFKEGSAIAHLTACRRRQHPLEFGRSSTYVETVDVPLLEEYSLRFLRAIDYYGLVEIEFKRDPRDGQYRLLDVNGRTWGYHSIGRQAGTDFPYLLFSDQMNNPVESSRGRVGVRWIRLLTDLPTGVVGLLKGEFKGGSYLKSLYGYDEEAVFSLDDPLPGVVEMALMPYLSAKRGF